MTTLLLTGASGFVGGAVLKVAQQRGMMIRPVFRSFASAKELSGAVYVSSLDGDTDWSSALKGVDVVIHAAARAHVMHRDALDLLTEYRRINVQGTINLARQSVDAGVKRMVFISSIGVNGAETFNKPFSVYDKPAPHSPYAVSKLEAEQGLLALASETGMEIVIIRPPLVYGPNAPGNFGSLMYWLDRGVPLPLGAVSHNRRSLVGLDNLVDLILTCVEHPKAANQIFLVSDGEDLSTKELLKRLTIAMNSPTYLFSIPVGFLAFLAKLFGKRAIAQHLLRSLQVDIRETCELLNWAPPMSVDEGLRKAAKETK